MMVFEASFTGVLRMVLIILAIYFLVRLLGRLLKPFMDSTTPPRNGRSERRKEGDVTIEYTEEKKKRRRNKDDDGEGDYIDFEELD